MHLHGLSYSLVYSITCTYNFCLPFSLWYIVWLMWINSFRRDPCSSSCALYVLSILWTSSSSQHVLLCRRHPCICQRMTFFHKFVLMFCVIAYTGIWFCHSGIIFLLYLLNERWNYVALPNVWYKKMECPLPFHSVRITIVFYLPEYQVLLIPLSVSQTNSPNVGSLLSLVHLFRSLSSEISSRVT